jgi:hypothetical protein
MNFITIPTEQTTAVTDAILALVAFFAVYSLSSLRGVNREKAKLWMLIFGLLGIGALLGAIAHGFEMSEIVNRALWMPLFFCLIMVVTLILAAAILDWKGEAAFLKARPWIVLLGLVAFAVSATLSFFIERYFIIFIIYQSLAMLFALFTYMKLWAGQKRNDAAVMTLGILITIFAAVEQALRLWSFTLIWQFDHNGVYHLIQVVGLFVILAAVRKGIRANPA